MNSLRHALRSLLRTPGFTGVAIITLALGIGLNTAMFSLINTLVFKPLSYPASHELFQLQRATARERDGSHSGPNIERILQESADFAELAPYRHWGFTLSGSDRPAEMLNALRVSANFFGVLRVKPELGRDFRPDEEEAGRNHVILLSHSCWVSRFGADPRVIGRVLRIDGEPTEIIGVVPESAASPFLFGTMQVFRPLGLNEDERTQRMNNSIQVLGRYKAGITAEQAAPRFAAIGQRLAADFPKENGDSGLRVMSLESARLGDVGKHITSMLMSLSTFVLLIACANLANLLLARAMARSREFAICAALGASRGQLIKPLILECSVLAVVGGVLGVVVSIWTNAWIATRLSGQDGPPMVFSTDWRVMVFALLASLLTGVFFGVTPAWLISRAKINETLKSGARGSTGDRSQHRFRQALIVAQFALALVLLSGAAFFLRGVKHLIQSEAGWNPAPLVRGIVTLPNSKYADPDAMYRFYRTVQERLSALPGVETSTVSLDLPVFGFPISRGYIVEGRPVPQAGQETLSFVNAVTPEYFAATGTRLRAGRGFDENDKRTSPPVVIISQTMAKTLFPDGDAIGHRLARFGEKETTWAQIVGVVDDVRFLNVAPSPIRNQMYMPLTQETWGYVNITAKVKSGAATLIEPFKAVIHDLDADMPVMDLRPVPQSIERNLDDMKMVYQLLVGFAALGLFLAALGIYSVITRIVLQRTGEVGVRMALGARAFDVIQLILGMGLKMTLIGAALGLLGTYFLARFLTSTLPGLSGGSGITVALATLLLVGIAVLACYLPARRATKVDPLVALRTE